MSDIVPRIPCVTETLAIDSYEGSKCWNPGWGSAMIGGAWATNLESIGVNLVNKITCQMRSYWRNLYDDEICAVVPPTDTTGINGYGYHVVAGGKETCSGDYGAPLLCDINGVNTLVGINSRGYGKCGAEGYPAIHLSLNSVLSWIDDTIRNESGIIWAEWSKCDSECKQTRFRTKYESEIRDCKGVCFKTVSDNIDETMIVCSLNDNRKKRSVEFQKRILGGQTVIKGVMPYVVKLKFNQNDSDDQEFDQLCAGTVVHKNFVLTSKFCCGSGEKVTITVDSSTSNLFTSNTFYLHPSFDSCLIRIEADLSQYVDKMPCLPSIIDINKYNGAACWNAGWGTAEVDGAFVNEMQSIGINLMSQGYCTDHSFWEILDGYMCAGLPPSDTTPLKGWKHVTAGGKETCQGDFGAPLICDIDGVATLIGINSDGDLSECGKPGKPAIHVNVEEIVFWIRHTIQQWAPPKTCFVLSSDPTIEDALGDEIKLLKNGVEVGVALGANQISNEVCLQDTEDADRFEFRNGGTDNVHINEMYINGILKDFGPIWIDDDTDIENDPYTTECIGETNAINTHAYTQFTIRNGEIIELSSHCIINQPVYSDWSEYSNCSKTCGEGQKTRTRSCIGGTCSLATDNDLNETTTCNDRGCLLQWESFSSCSTTCGSGIKTRERLCIDGPTGTNDDCPESLQDQETCNERGCLSSWGSYSSCSKTCGNGEKTRYRACTEGPTNTNVDCPETLHDQSSCNNRGCLSSWGSWSSCSKSCGDGVKTRRRFCRYGPTGSNNDCPESLTGYKSCRERYCIKKAILCSLSMDGPTIATLSCETGKTIKVQSAVYGRMDKQHCNTHCNWSPLSSTPCRICSTTHNLEQSVVGPLCDGSRICEMQHFFIHHLVHLLGDPCVNSHKFTRIDYYCR